MEGNGLPAILQQINWVDIFFIILLLGMVYKGSRVGVGGQIIPLAGWIVLLFVSIGYYQYLSEAVFGFSVQAWAKPISFFAISACLFTAIKFFERIFSAIHSEEVAVLEKIGGAMVAAFRAFISFGIIGIFMLLCPIGFLRDSAATGSKTCMYFVKMDAAIYSGITSLMGEGKKRSTEELLKEFTASK